MLDHVRQMIIEKFVSRSKIGSNMSGIIIPAIINDLNAKTKSIKDREVLICGLAKAEVSVNRFRNAVNLEEKTCSYRAWQVTGKPCSMLWLSLQRSVEKSRWMNLSMNTSLLIGSERHMHLHSIQ